MLRQVGTISTTEAVDEFVEMGYPLVDARAKVAELQASIFALEGKDVVINIRTNTVGSGIYTPRTTTPTGQTPSQGGYEFAAGANFTVPGGFPNDSFGPMWAQSGEHVAITPAGQSKPGPAVINNYYITNENAEAAAINKAIIESRELEQLRANL